METMRTAITALALAALLCACADMGFPRPGPSCNELSDALTDLPERAPRLDFEGFSILPPQGSNWCMILNKQHGGIFMKNTYGGRQITHRPPESEVRNTLIAGANAAPPRGQIENSADLERMAREEFESGAMGPNVGTTRMKITPEALAGGTSCIRLEGTWEGKLSRTFPHTDFVLVAESLTCKHPTRLLLIGVSVSERYLKASPPAVTLTRRYRDELQPFLHGLEIAP